MELVPAAKAVTEMVEKFPVGMHVLTRHGQMRYLPLYVTEIILLLCYIYVYVSLNNSGPRT